MDQTEIPDFIESKVVLFNGPDGQGEYKVILTAFEGEDVTPLNRAGYRGEYVQFSIIDGGVIESFTDPYDSRIVASGEDFFAFMLAVREGYRSDGMAGIPWEQLRHGGEYTITDFPDIYPNA